MNLIAKKCPGLACGINIVKAIVKIKIALSKDEVGILIKILVGDLGPSYLEEVKFRM